MDNQLSFGDGTKIYSSGTYKKPFLKFPAKDGYSEERRAYGSDDKLAAKVVLDESSDPISASMRYFAKDLHDYAYMDGKTPKRVEEYQSIRSEFWGDGTPSYYATKNGTTYERGHLLGNYVTGTFGFEDWNQLPMARDMNSKGAFRKAEAIGSMFAESDPDNPVTFRVLVDWRNPKNGKEITEVGGEKIVKESKIPSAFVVQLEGVNGSNTFYIPNNNEAMQEPTKYMVNKKWMEENFGELHDNEILKSMPDEEGYRQQFDSYLKNVAGKRVRPGVSLMDAVKEAYMSQPIFRDQIRDAKKRGK